MINKWMGLASIEIIVNVYEKVFTFPREWIKDDPEWGDKTTKY